MTSLFLNKFILYLTVSVLILFPGYIFGAEQPGFDTEKDNIQLDAMPEKHDKYTAIARSELEPNRTSGRANIYSNPVFIFLDNQSGVISYGLSSYWIDPNSSCTGMFKCTPNVTLPRNDNTSFRISTTNNTNNTWSWIYGQPVSVKPDENYKVITHMKLNRWATQSHVALEGFNETSNDWYQISQCPSGTNGPLEWSEFSCASVIPENTTKIRPVLNAGWSSIADKEATTWFDSTYIVKLGQIVSDPHLKVETVYQGLERPTSITFLGPNDFLVSEVLGGTVQRVVNGIKLTQPVIQLDVSQREGLLGLAAQKNITKNQSGDDKEITYVFLYYTTPKKDGGKDSSNVLYRYELVNNNLVNPKLLLEVPAGFEHNGGEILIGPDKYIYLAVGELKNKTTLSHERNKALNNLSNYAGEPDGRGGILRIDQNGQVIDTHGILGDEAPLDKYYAYGIRNIFGIDFDPVTEKLWDTENGPTFGDEINLVEPGFNSGWRKVQGIWNIADGKSNGEEKKEGLASEEPDNLVDFDSRGKYSPPEFTWDHPVGPTALKFLTTDKLGKEYENDMFVADSNNGRIYHFELNGDRTALSLEGPLKDKLAGTVNELDDMIFSAVSGSITDLEIGSDGNLYIIAYGSGILYRVSPSL